MEGNMKSKWINAGLGALLLVGAFEVTPVHAISVGTELLLLADVSGSLDSNDFELQRNGYAAAFRDTAVINAIESELGGVAVALVYWSDSPSIAVDWYQITDATTSNDFANLIMAASRPSSGSTNMAAFPVLPLRPPM
jgi:hypothetical protein